jgi:glycerol-3-phosphate dehydrogenase
MHRVSNQAILSAGADGAAQESWQAPQQRGHALTHQRACRALCGPSVSLPVSAGFIRRIALVSKLNSIAQKVERRRRAAATRARLNADQGRL